MGSSVDKLTSWVVFLMTCAAVVLALGGCSNAQGDDRLQGGEVRSALTNLPFPYKLWTVKPPVGAEAAFRGVAHGKHKSTLHFAITVGDSPEPILIPKTKLQNPYGSAKAGFVFNSDSAEGTKFQTNSQWYAAMDMSVAIQERLCKKATGEVCPI
jgi:hypothetical protein